MLNPRLSIVTPTRNAPHLMDRLFDSLVRQTCPEFEYVLVDTSDGEQTFERWWRDFAPHLDHRFRYTRIRLPSPDMAAAFEYAFNQARGEYVCPMTQKALWRPDAVDSIHRILDRYPGITSFAFKSLYVDADLHVGRGAFPIMEQIDFGSAWAGEAPAVMNSRQLFEDNIRAFTEYGYTIPHIATHLKMPFASHALYARSLLDRVRERFGTIVAGKFAADARLGYRVMDLESEVLLFREFEPRLSSMHGNTGGAGSQLSSWTYLRKVFETLSAETKQVISRSPFGYLPLWSVQTYWELFSVAAEAQGHLRMDIAFAPGSVASVLSAEIAQLTDIDEGTRAGLLRHVEAIADRIGPGELRSWF